MLLPIRQTQFFFQGHSFLAESGEDYSMSGDCLILALDEGTTSARALLFNHEAEVLSSGQYKIRQCYPRPGWVEQDPVDIWRAQLRAVRKAMRDAKIDPSRIAAAGI